MLRRLIIIWPLLLAGCAPRGGTSPVAGAEPPGLVAQIQSLIEAVSAQRGLVKRDLKVEMCDDATMRAEVAREVAAAAALPETAELALWNELMGSTEPVGESSFAAEPTLTIYDSTGDRLLVRRGTRAPEPRMLFVREIARALLARTGTEKPTRDLDQTLAQSALRRGDAVLSMLLDAQTQKREASLVIAAERTRLFLANQTDESLIDATGMSRALLSAPRWVRERALFPDTAGFAFAVALHRTEGFSLIDRVHARAPVSSEQILHPELYMADDKPVIIAPPRTPSGTSAVATLTLGELGLRAFLARCLPLPRARSAAEGWGGDVLVVSERADKTRVVAGTSRWDSEADAKEAEGALRELGACWMTHGATKSFFVARRGEDLAFVSGLADESAKTELVALLSLERTRPSAVPPFGTKVIAPPVALPETAPDRRGTVTDGIYQHPRFGLRMSLPQGYEANTTLPGVELLLRGGRQSASSGVFTTSKTAWTVKNQEDVFAGVSAMFSQQMGRAADLNMVRDEPVTLLGATGRERLYAVATTQVGIRVVLLPVCDGRWLLAFFASSVAEADRVALDNWISSLARTGGEPTACAE